MNRTGTAVWMLCTLAFTSCGVASARAAQEREVGAVAMVSRAAVTSGASAAGESPRALLERALPPVDTSASQAPPAPRSDEREVNMEAVLRMYLRLASGRPLEAR